MKAILHFRHIVFYIGVLNKNMSLNRYECQHFRLQINRK